MTDQRRGDHVTDPEDLGQGRARRATAAGSAPLRFFALFVEAGDIVEEFEREAMPFSTDRTGRFDVLEERKACEQRLLWDPARHELADQRVEATHRLVARPRDLE